MKIKITLEEALEILSQAIADKTSHVLTFKDKGHIVCHLEGLAEDPKIAVDGFEFEIEDK